MITPALSTYWESNIKMTELESKIKSSSEYFLELFASAVG
jgi:hypothetical protein